MGLRPLRLFWCFLVALVCLSNELRAQTTTSGGLTGVVTDPSHAVVPNAVVEIKDNAKGTVQTTKSDREGVYRFFFLAPGTYVLAVAHAGFREQRRTVDVLLGPPVSVNIALEIAKANSEISVTDEAPLIQAENGDDSTTASQKQISEVPNPGNDLTYIVQTTPGVLMNTDGAAGVFSSLGMPGTSNLFTIDGLSQNDNGPNLNLVGASFTWLGQNQIQEATVVNIGYSGQYGGAAGTNVNYLTKSGSSVFHGNAQYYWNGSVLNANDWFNKAFGNPRPFEIAHQWAGSLGGPIRKDKLFFFFDTEGLRLLIPKFFAVTLPSPQFEAATIANIDSDPRFGSGSATGAFYRKLFNLYNAAPGASVATPGNFSDSLGCPGFSDLRTGLGISVPCALHFLSRRGSLTDDTLLSGRIDWVPREHDRTFIRIQDDFGNNSFYKDPISSIFDAIHHQSWWQGELVETHTFSSRAASQFLVAGMYFTDTNELESPTLAVAAMPVIANFGNTGAYTNMASFNSLAFPNGRPTTRYQIAEDLVKTWKNHKLGTGANLERIYWTNKGYGLNAIGTLTPQTLDAFYYGGLDPATPSTDFTQLTQSFFSVNSERINFYNLGVYGQDEWHAQPNLTLTFSLRAEHFSNPVCPAACFARLTGSFESVSHDPSQPYNHAIVVNQKQAFQSMESILWSPRFSFAWQPMGVSHRTVIRGGVGIFYDPLPGDLAWIFSSNPPMLNSYAMVGDNLAPDETTSLSKDAAASNAAFVNGFKAGKTLAQIQANAPRFSPPAITVPGSQTQVPRYQRWSFELQQAFGSGTSLNIGYFGHHGIHELLQNANANAYGFGSLASELCSSPPVPPCADPRFAQVTEDITSAVSNYNGMVVSFQHRFTHWTPGIFQVNYTYSHAFDETSNGGLYSFTTVGLPYPQDPKNIRGAYGPADYDVRHSFNANYVWELPVKTALRGRGPDSLTKGWQVSGTIFARTGPPYTVIDFAASGSLVAKNSVGIIYAVPAHPLGSGASCGRGAAIPLAPDPCLPPQVLPDGTPNPNALFLQSGCATDFNTGNLPGPTGPCSGPQVTVAQGRNHFRGPGYFNTDFAIMKNNKIRGLEAATLGIGFQFFNFFNHPNFGFPDGFVANQSLGQIFYLEQPPTSILGSGLGDVAPRMIQVKMQLQF